MKTLTYHTTSAILLCVLNELHKRELVALMTVLDDLASGDVISANAIAKKHGWTWRRAQKALQYAETEGKACRVWGGWKKREEAAG